MVLVGHTLNSAGMEDLMTPIGQTSITYPEAPVSSLPSGLGHYNPGRFLFPMPGQVSISQATHPRFPRAVNRLELWIWDQCFSIVNTSSCGCVRNTGVLEWSVNPEESPEGIMCFAVWGSSLWLGPLLSRLWLVWASATPPWPSHKLLPCIGPRSGEGLPGQWEVWRIYCLTQTKDRQPKAHRVTWNVLK